MYKNKGKDKNPRTVMKQRTAMYMNACTETKQN